MQRTRFQQRLTPPAVSGGVGGLASEGRIIWAIALSQILASEGERSSRQTERQGALVVDVRRYRPSAEEYQQHQRQANNHKEGDRDGDPTGLSQERTSTSTGNTMLLP